MEVTLKNSEYPKSIVLDDDKLKQLIEEKNTLLLEGREVTRQIDELDQKRNKIGLRIQKFKDRIIPLTQKLAQPYLVDEFDDLETIDLVDGKPTVGIFNHLEDWKAGFRKQKAVK